VQNCAPFCFVKRGLQNASDIVAEATMLKLASQFDIDSNFAPKQAHARATPLPIWHEMRLINWHAEKGGLLGGMAMAEKNENANNASYFVGGALIIAAILVSAALWAGMDGLQKSISSMSLVVPASAASGNSGAASANGANAGAAAAAPSNGAAAAGAGNQAAVQAGDWSFTATDPAVGPANAAITVTEFADYQCPYCGIAFGSSIGGAQMDSLRGTATKLATNYAATGKIRFIYHTMGFLGQGSIDAANAALCARAIGGDSAYFQMRDKLCQMQGSENSGAFSKTNLKLYASQIGFNTAAMASCIDNGTYNSQVSQSNSQALAAGVQSTPTFAVNNVVAQDPTYAALSAQIDSLLKN